MTHAGYRQLASRTNLPVEVRRAALGALVDVHDRALAILQTRAFNGAETRAMRGRSTASEPGASRNEATARMKP